MFDASHMGQIEVAGEGAFSFLQNLITNDLSLISAFQMQYNLLLNSSGGIIDDCMVYHLGDKFLCVVNASNKDKVLSWFNKNKPDKVEISDKSSQLALISVQGPLAWDLVTKVFGSKANDLNYLSFFQGQLESKSFLISRSGYTAEDGFEVYVSWDQASLWWDRFVEEGKNCKLTLCGLGARDILRIEAGYPLYGHELDETINPYQASLAWAVKLNKQFIGKEAVVKAKAQDLKTKRVGFIMKERSMPRQGYSIYCQQRLVGTVSSGVFSPNLDKFIGMAYLDRELADSGNEIKLKIRDKFYQAEVVNFPFITPRTKKLANRRI